MLMLMCLTVQQGAKFLSFSNLNAVTGGGVCAYADLFDCGAGRGVPELQWF